MSKNEQEYIPSSSLACGADSSHRSTALAPPRVRPPRPPAGPSPTPASQPHVPGPAPPPPPCPPRSKHTQEPRKKERRGRRTSFGPASGAGISSGAAAAARGPCR